MPASRRNGSVTRNVLPAPTVLSTAMLPSSSEMIPLQIASPSPVPSPVGFVVKNGSKIRSRFAFGMPLPVSEISTATRSSSAAAIRIRISFSSGVPRSMACAAFTRRLTNTCVRRASFAWTRPTSTYSRTSRARDSRSTETMRAAKSTTRSSETVSSRSS